jgi:hypothetical protein
MLLHSFVAPLVVESREAGVAYCITIVQELIISVASKPTGGILLWPTVQ